MNRRYGRYEVLYKLGQGAMAQVFLARDPVLSRYVAVKVLHADLASRKDVLQRFFNEARTVAVVRNPHVVEVFDFGQEGEDLYLVMEFVDGLSLHGVLRQLPPTRPGPVDRQDPFSRLDNPPLREPVLAFEPLDSAIAAALMCQAAEGLTQAARHGVVHRDIKPENLMINREGYLKISDFGIAHVQDDNITKTGAVLGSPLYMSPEQARGLKPITSQADMFSLGAVFYACLVGHPPFHGRNITDLFRKIANQPHAPLWRLRPDLDPALGGLIETLLQKNPADRGGGPRWLHRQLKGYLMALGVMDPADLISGYMQDLASRGIKTTWRMEGTDVPRPATLPAATLPMRTVATERYMRESDRRVPSAALGAVLAILGMAAAGIGWGLWNSRAGLGALESSAGRWPGYVQSASSGSSQTIPQATLQAASGRHPQVASASFAPDPGAGAAGMEVRPGLDGATGSEELPSPEAQDAASGDGIAEGTTLHAFTSGDALRTASGPAGPSGRRASAENAALATPLATPITAALELKSSPPFAEAFVDGNYIGVTPVRLESLPAGRHRVVLKIKRTPAFDTVLVLKPGLQSFKFRMGEDGPGRLAATPEDGP